MMEGKLVRSFLTFFLSISTFMIASNPFQSRQRLQNCKFWLVSQSVIKTPRYLRIAPINHQAKQPSSLLTIQPFNLRSSKEQPSFQPYNQIKDDIIHVKLTTLVEKTAGSYLMLLTICFLFVSILDFRFCFKVLINCHQQGSYVELHGNIPPAD